MTDTLLGLLSSYYPHMPTTKAWIYRLPFVFRCCNFVVVHRRLWQGISPFGELCSTRSGKLASEWATPIYGNV